MFEHFSSGYYLGSLYVQPRGEDEAAIRRDDHECVNEQLYATGDGVERLDNPLVMKVGTRHYPVVGDGDVPHGTLRLPRDAVPDDLEGKLPGRREVFLANAERAKDLLKYTGWNGESST